MGHKTTSLFNICFYLSALQRLVKLNKKLFFVTITERRSNLFCPPSLSDSDFSAAAEFRISLCEMRRQIILITTSSSRNYTKEDVPSIFGYFRRPRLRFFGC